MVQSAWPSLVHSSGVRTSTMMVFPALVVSCETVASWFASAITALEFSVFDALVVVELQLMAYKEEAIIRNANAIFFIFAKFLIFLWI